MRTRLLCCLAALFASACIKRVSPAPGDDRGTLSGVPLVFGQPDEIPEGTEVSWNFGDGTPPAKGPRATHAFPRAGVYTVVESIQDPDGKVRTARTHVVALRRPVPMAVPADVRAVLMVLAPWAKVAVHREVAGKLSLGAFFDEVARTVSEAAGFDALDPKAADANGFDPDEGVAFFTIPQDPEALVLAVGTSDDGKSLAAARRLLTYPKGVGRYSAGPFQLNEEKLEDGTPVVLGQNAAGDRVGVLQRYGYLYLRTAGATDPRIALKRAAALPPDKGLAVDARFLAAAKHIGAGDAVFYSRPAEGAAPELRLSGELGASAFAVVDQPELLQLRMYSQLRNLNGGQLAAAFTPSGPPPDLAARLPSGAAVYLRLSASPAALWRELTRAAGADTARLRDRVQESMGLDVEKDLIPSFTGNVGIAVYLDASSLIEAILGEQVGSLDRSSFLVAAELSSPDIVQAALERAMKPRPATDRAVVNGANYFRLGDGAQAAIKDGMLFLAIGGQPPPALAEEAPVRGRKKARPPPPPKAIAPPEMGVLGRVLTANGGGSLGRELYSSGLRGFDRVGQQDAWVDVAGIVRSIERAGADQGGVAGQSARLFAERAAALRDALIQARATPEGLDADLWIRFLPRKTASK
jgi:hypothetical protein